MLLELLKPILTTIHSFFEAYWTKKAASCQTIDDLSKQMKRRVPSVVSDYFVGAASDEQTMNENVDAFQKIYFKPRYGIKHEEVNLKTKVLGQEISMPVLAGPIGSLRTMWPNGEVLAAKASGEAGTVITLSTLTGTPLEQVKAASSGPCWFQLYLVGGKEVAIKAIERAKKAGYQALVLTIDTPVAGMRLRDRRNGSMTLINGKWWQKAKFTPQMLQHLTWLTGFYADGGLMQFPNIELPGNKVMPYTDIGSQLQKAAVTWEDIEWIKAAWDGPIIIKGIHSLEDAKLAEKYGASAIIISNHGGRQLDRVLPSLEVLKQVAPVMKDSKVEILMDGGIRSGGDAVIALALGAKAVLLGRAYAFSLGAAGEAGVRRAYEIMREQIEHTLRQLGCRSVEELDLNVLES